MDFYNIFVPLSLQFDHLCTKATLICWLSWNESEIRTLVELRHPTNKTTDHSTGLNYTASLQHNITQIILGFAFFWQTLSNTMTNTIFTDKKQNEPQAKWYARFVRWIESKLIGGTRGLLNITKNHATPTLQKPLYARLLRLNCNEQRFGCCRLSVSQTGSNWRSLQYFPSDTGNTSIQKSTHNPCQTNLS